MILVHGSFTGIRIGIASIKAIAESLDIPVIDVSSLEALAYNIENTNCETICSLIDARNNQVYNAIFEICAGSTCCWCSWRRFGCRLSEKNFRLCRTKI